MAKTHGTNVHTIDGKSYVEVERKAEVGDYVTKDGIIREVTEVSEENGGYVEFVSYDDSNGEVVGWVDGHYKVLEPVASEEWPPLELTETDVRKQPDKVIDLLANLARRVSSLEAQLADTQRNVERQAEELENEKEYRSLLYRKVSDLKDQVESNESDIVMLDERTADHRQELNVIDHEKAMIFEDIVSLSKRIRKLNGGAAE